jgi:DNA repair exonuclease SbcCD nuclease subunit
VTFSFIHTGDLHLDSPLSGLAALDDPRASALGEASRRAFDELVDIAIARKVDAVLIAGDLWDGDWSDVSAGLHVQEQVTKLERAGIRTFAVLGNHDAASRVTDRIRDIAALHLFPADRPASVECGPAVIHGMSYSRPDLSDNIAAIYPEAVPGKVNIGLLHTALEGAKDHAPYAPCTLQDLVRRRYHYWALGHVHTRCVLAEAAAGEGGTVAYCGVLQGRHVRETGVKGAWHGVIEDDRVRLSPLDFGHASWFVAEADVSTEDDRSAIRAALEEVAARVSASIKLAVVRVRLMGATERHFALSTRRAELVETARFLARAVDSRLLVEDVRLDTTPPAEAVQATLPHRFDALLAHAAADPAVAETASKEIVDILNACGADVRRHLEEIAPELAAFEATGDMRPLLDDAARRVTARLRAEED